VTRRRSRPALDFTTILVCSVVLAVTACNFVGLRRGQIERDLRRDGLRQEVARVGDATVSYWVGGEGDPVLLLHGFGASAIWQWHGQVEAIAKRYRVIIPDLLWFGGSSSTARDFTLDHQVRAMIGLLDQEGASQAHVVGISYGGLVAYQLASTHPERVARVVLADTPGRVYEGEDLVKLRRRFGVERVADLLIPSGPEGVERLLEIAYYDPPYTPSGVLENVLEEFYSDGREEQAQLLGSVIGQMDELRAAPDGYDAETLVVWGREDRIFPLEIGLRLTAHLGDRAEMVVIDEARHAPNVEHPERFNDELLRFLSR